MLGHFYCFSVTVTAHPSIQFGAIALLGIQVGGIAARRIMAGMVTVGQCGLPLL